MKKILYILLFHISTISLAQDPRLFQNDWYLNKVILDGVDYPAPHNSEVEYVTLVLRSEPYGFDTEVCDILDASTVEITNTDIATNEIVFLSNGPCNIQENNDFQSLYFEFFYVINPTTQAYQYTYAIDNVQGYLQLTLTNYEGNQVIYGEQLLGISNNNQVEIVLYPKPSKDFITIQSSFPVDEVVFYDVFGKKLFFLRKDFQQIDVSSFPKGIYFVAITTAKGKMLRKLIKN